MEVIDWGVNYVTLSSTLVVLKALLVVLMKHTSCSTGNVILSICTHLTQIVTLWIKVAQDALVEVPFYIILHCFNVSVEFVEADAAIVLELRVGQYSIMIRYRVLRWQMHWHCNVWNVLLLLRLSKHIMKFSNDAFGFISFINYFYLWLSIVDVFLIFLCVIQLIVL